MTSYQPPLTDHCQFSILQFGSSKGDRMQFDHLKRRDFITMLAVAAPLLHEARAQQPAMPVIGFLGAGTRSASDWVAAFVQRLRELDWIESRNLMIEYRWAEGRPERAAESAAEFVRRKVDVTVAQGTPATVAVEQATGVIQSSSRPSAIQLATTL